MFNKKNDSSDDKRDYNKLKNMAWSIKSAQIMINDVKFYFKGCNKKKY